MKKFTGTMPALVTPLNADETLNTAALAHLVGDLLAAGADGFYVGGATGEGISLRREVREQLAEETIRLVNHQKPVIMHIASANFHEAIHLAKHAERAGADAVSAIPPLFYPYDEDDVYNYYKAIADAVHIPVMIYYNPAAGFTVNAEFAARVFGIDNVTAIKWTSSDYYGMIKLKEMTHGEMNIINGPDEMLLMGLNAGADGGIGTTYNFLYPVIHRVYRNFVEGNIAGAQQAQFEADRMIAALLKYRTIPATKAVLERMGYAVGDATFPMKRYTEAQKDQIYADLVAAGLKPLR